MSQWVFFTADILYKTDDCTILSGVLVWGTWTQQNHLCFSYYDKSNRLCKCLWRFLWDLKTAHNIAIQVWTFVNDKFSEKEIYCICKPPRLRGDMFGEFCLTVSILTRWVGSLVYLLLVFQIISSFRNLGLLLFVLYQIICSTKIKGRLYTAKMQSLRCINYLQRLPYKVISEKIQTWQNSPSAACICTVTTPRYSGNKSSTSLFKHH